MSAKPGSTNQKWDGAPGRWGLVLGPGGARVFAHLGVAAALMGRGVAPPAFIAASGLASLPAALLAAGRPARQTAQVLAGLNGPQLIGRGRPPWALKPLLDASAVLLQIETFCVLPTPLILSAYEAQAGRLHLIRSGSLIDALHGALAVPGLLTGRALDGGQWQSAAPFMPFVETLPEGARPLFVDLGGGRVDVATPLQLLWRTLELPPGAPPQDGARLAIRPACTPWDFDAAEAAFDAGVEAVASNWETLRALCR